MSADTCFTDCIEVWYDGCCEPVNPGGHAAAGVVIKRDGHVIWQESRYIGHGLQMSTTWPSTAAL
jgi:ribonuclease HI